LGDAMSNARLIKKEIIKKYDVNIKISITSHPNYDVYNVKIMDMSVINFVKHNKLRSRIIKSIKYFRDKKNFIINYMFISKRLYGTSPNTY
jgi:hypothetical protein